MTTDDLPGFFEGGMAEAQRMDSTTSRSTRENYMTALRSLHRYLETDLPLNCIDASLIQNYERWLLNQGVCPNSTSCYVRSLRAVLGRLAATHKIDIGQAFKSVFTGRASTSKRSITLETVRQLMDVQLIDGSSMELARDIFLFCLYASGMPFVDAAFLRKSQIADGKIVYHRHKTGTRITVIMLPCMQQIIDRYATADREYVFPILHTMEPQAAYNEYLSKLNWYNRMLKKIAVTAGIGQPLTGYQARHTWATTAYHANVELPVISKALGHTNPQTTLTYLREIDDCQLEKASRRVAAVITEL